MGISDKKKQSGQSLIEALVALGAAVLVVSAITVTVISALNNVQYSKNQNLAGQYAQQALEVVRQMSLSNWTQLTSYDAVKYCMNEGTTVLSTPDPSSNSCGQNYGIFVREVDITQNSIQCSGAVLAAASVSWSDGKCSSSNVYCHNVTLSSCFTNVNSNMFNTP